ncbi:helix-turn-helix domain-containing protein [Amedibacillus sp. YH-ame6]
MNTNIGEKITELRIHKKYTQKQLAQLCNVSSAAISKWENNQSLPDISTLPILARIFQISIDELLCFEPELSLQQVDELVKDIVEKFSSTSFEDAMAYCKNIVRMYPNSEMLKFKIAGSIGTITIYLYQSEQPQKYTEQFQDYAKQLITPILTSKDLIIRQGACILMSTYFAKEGNTQESLDLIQSIPKLSNTTSIECSLYQKLHQNDKAIHLLQSQLYADSTQIYMNLFSLINLAFQEQKKEDAKALLSTMELLHKTFPIASSFYPQCYIFYARLKDRENTLRLLKEYIYGLRHMDNTVRNMKNYLETNPCFHTILLKENAHPQQLNEQIIQHMLLECKDLDFIRDDKEYLEIIKEA